MKNIKLMAKHTKPRKKCRDGNHETSMKPKCLRLRNRKKNAKHRKLTTPMEPMKPQYPPKHQSMKSKSHETMKPKIKETDETKKLKNPRKRWNHETHQNTTPMKPRNHETQETHETMKPTKPRDQRNHETRGTMKPMKLHEPNKTTKVTKP